MKIKSRLFMKLKMKMPISTVVRQIPGLSKLPIATLNLYKVWGNYLCLWHRYVTSVWLNGKLTRRQIQTVVENVEELWHIYRRNAGATSINLELLNMTSTALQFCCGNYSQRKCLINMVLSAFPLLLVIAVNIHFGFKSKHLMWNFIVFMLKYFDTLVKF